MIVEEKSKEESELRKLSDNFVRTYEDGVKDGMKEQIMEDLESAAMHIEILEADLAVERTKKWNAINKLKMIDAHKGNIGMLRYALEEGEQLTLHDKIELIKEGWSK